MSSIYKPREPTQTLLYQSVAQAWPQLQASCATGDRPLARYVEAEIERYLSCGILERGFARIHCGSCGFDRLVHARRRVSASDKVGRGCRGVV